MQNSYFDNSFFLTLQIYIKFLVQQYNKRLFPPQKPKIIKQKQKITTKSIKENNKKILQEFYRNISQDKLIIEIMLQSLS